MSDQKAKEIKRMLAALDRDISRELSGEPVTKMSDSNTGTLTGRMSTPQVQGHNKWLEFDYKATEKRMMREWKNQILAEPWRPPSIPTYAEMMRETQKEGLTDEWELWIAAQEEIARIKREQDERKEANRKRKAKEAADRRRRKADWGF